MSREALAELIEEAMDDAMDVDVGTHQLAKAAADAILAAIPDLVWQQNGDHHAGGHGYVIRKMGSQFTMTGRNRHPRQFDTLGEAKAVANQEHKAYLAQAMGWTV